jgi:hypothetical protein
VKYKYLIFFLLSSFIVVSLALVPAHAHPGRTDSSGGHTCRTNCASWGLGQGEYHSHGGGASGSTSQSTDTPPAVETNQTEPNQRFFELRKAILQATPTEMPATTPTRLPTRIPTPTVTIAPSPTAMPSPTTAPKQKARPVQTIVQAPKQQGFFAWFLSLFR